MGFRELTDRYNSYRSKTKVGLRIASVVFQLGGVLLDHKYPGGLGDNLALFGLGLGFCYCFSQIQCERLS